MERPEKKPHSTGSIVGAVVLLVVVLLALYVGGYFALGEYQFWPNATYPFSTPRDIHLREYSYDALAWGYYPLGYVEATVTGTRVVLCSPHCEYGFDK